MRRCPALCTLLLVLLTNLMACGGTVATTAEVDINATTGRRPTMVSPPTMLASVPPSSAGGQGGGTLTGCVRCRAGRQPAELQSLTQGAGFVWLEKYFSKLRRLRRGLHQAPGRTGRVVGDLARRDAVHLQAAQGHDLARRPALHLGGRQVLGRALQEPRQRQPLRAEVHRHHRDHRRPTR